MQDPVLAGEVIKRWTIGKVSRRSGHGPRCAPLHTID